MIFFKDRKNTDRRMRGEVSPLITTSKLFSITPLAWGPAPNPKFPTAPASAPVPDAAPGSKHSPVVVRSGSCYARASIRSPQPSREKYGHTWLIVRQLISPFSPQGDAFLCGSFCQINLQAGVLRTNLTAPPFPAGRSYGRNGAAFPSWIKLRNKV